MDTYIQVIFERRKNDQFGDNSRTVVPARTESPACPVQLIRLYFQRFGLQFGGGGKLVNFRLQKTAGRHLPLSHGDILFVMSRSSQHVLGAHVLQYGWDTQVPITPAIVSEMSHPYVFSSFVATV